MPSLWLRLLVLVTATLSATRVTNAQNTRADQLTKQILVEALRHQEELVRSAYCVWELRKTPTRPEQIPLVQAVCNIRGTDFRACLWTDEDALAHSAVMRWWRKGEKERIESYEWGSGTLTRPLLTKAFDGQFVRSLSGDGARGSLHTVESLHWHTGGRIHPFTLIYHYKNRPYSELVGAGALVFVERMLEEAEPLWHVSFRDPLSQKTTFTMLLDRQLRLLQRDLITTYASDVPRLIQRHHFSDYQAHEDASGEAVIFPHKVVIQYFPGTLPDGTHAEATTDVIRIREIKFNVPIPDEMFVLDFPADAEIYDATQGTVFGKTSSAGAAMPRQDHTRWILPANLILLGVAVIVTVAWRVTKSRRGRGGSTGPHLTGSARGEAAEPPS